MATETDVGSTRSRVAAQAAIALAGALFCGVLVRALVPNHDNAFHLDVAGQMLAGGRYFYDFMEINPPLYSVLMIPVHGLRAVTGMDLYSAFIVWISAFIVASSSIVWSQSSECLDEGIAGRTVAVLCVEAVLFFMPGMDFGQRDHLAIVLILPSLPWLATRKHGRAMTFGGAAIMAAAGVGVLIKPFLLLAVGLPYLARMLDERNWRIVFERPVWILAAVAAVYVAVILIVFPEWLMVAKIGRVAYEAYDGPWLSRRIVLSAMVIVALALANEVLGRSNPRERRLGRMLASAAAGALASYVIQHKGIGYQLIPARITIALLTGFVVLVAVRWVAVITGAAAVRRYRTLSVCLVAVVPLSSDFEKAVSDADRIERSMRSLTAFMDDVHIGPRVIVFGASAYQAPLSIYRNSAMWIVPWIVRQQRAGRGDEPETLEIEAQLRTLVRDDFRRFRPDGIIVDVSPNQIAGLPPSFDMMDWFRQDPEMAAMLDGYERIATFKDPNERRWSFTDLVLYRRRQP
jgi:hypothetical protein